MTYRSSLSAALIVCLGLAIFIAGRADAILAGDLAIAEAMTERRIDPSTFKMIVEKDNPLHAYFGRKFLQAKPEFMQQLNKLIPACQKKN